MRALTFATALVVLVAAGLALWPHESHDRVDPCGPTTAEPWKGDLNAAAQATVCLINRERTQRGLPALRENPLLNQASLEHSQDMVSKDYFEHTDPDGRSVGDRLQDLGYQHGVNHSGGENIAYGVGPEGTPASIVDLWMHSPGHRADILRPTFTEIGIGIALGAPEVGLLKQNHSATYTTDFGGVFDPSLGTG